MSTPEARDRVTIGTTAEPGSVVGRTRIRVFADAAFGVAREGGEVPEEGGLAVQMKLLVAVGVVSLAAAALVAAPALGEETTCRGTIGARTVDNLRVPQGATCTLRGTRVEGTVKVGRAATLYAVRIRVVGNVQAEGAKRVNVGSSRVGGSIQVVQGRHSTVRSNRVVGDIQYFANRGRIVISRNRVNGNLQCKSNRPRPVGGGNIVQGNKEDQCARL